MQTTVKPELANSGILTLSQIHTMDEASAFLDLLNSTKQRRRLRALSECESSLTPLAKVLHCILNLMAGEDHDQIKWPSNRAMATFVGCEYHQVKRCLTQLVKAGLISYDTPELCPETIVTLHAPDTLATNRKRKVKTSDKPKMSPDELALIVSNEFMMERYIRFGIEGIRQPQNQSLPSTALDWRNVEGWTEKDPQAHKWTVNQLAGFYWFLVSWMRCKHLHIPLTLPNWGRLNNVLTEKLKQGIPATSIYDEIVFLITWWVPIETSCRKSNYYVALDETTLQNKVVNLRVASLRRTPDDERANLARSWLGE